MSPAFEWKGQGYEQRWYGVDGCAGDGRGGRRVANFVAGVPVELWVAGGGGESGGGGGVCFGEGPFDCARWGQVASILYGARAEADPCDCVFELRRVQRGQSAPRHILSCHPGYFCAPQVFYFTPQKKWYLICQAADESWGEPPYRPAFSTTTEISDPNSWTRLQPLYDTKPDIVKGWLDFWVICDDSKAHLFYTSLDGKMWRAETSLSAFPKGWSTPTVVLTGDIFEASHTYRLKGLNKYLTLVEAQNGYGWRYYKAYTADRLDGQWQPLAAEKDNAFASMRNVTPKGEKWTDVVSHVELLRSGRDEKLEVDPANLRLIFQGVLEKDHQGKSYGEIPWKLGLLESAR